MGFQYYLSLNAGHKYYRILQGEDSALLSTSIKETKSATMNIFRFFFFSFLFKSFVKVEFSYVFTINLFAIAENCTEKVKYLTKQVCFLMLVIICVPPIIIDS